MTLQTLNNTRELAQQLRVDSVRCTVSDLANTSPSYPPPPDGSPGATWNVDGRTAGYS